MSGSVDYRRYGLANGNPYVNRPIDPSRDTDQNLFLTLAVLPPMETIREHIAREAPGDGSTAFLLSGRSGAGRTTLAYLITKLYREMHGIDDLHLECFGRKDHDSLARTHRVIQAVRNAVMRRHRDRRQELKAEIPDIDDGMTELGLQAQADHLAYVMQDVRPRMHLGLLVDGVQDDGFMDTMAVVFRHVPAVVIVTRDEYRTADTASAKRLAERSEWQQWALHLHLPPLPAEDIEQITENRWRAAAGPAECPFELAGVRDVLGQRRLPAGSAIKWLGWLMEGKLKTTRGSERWPDARELHITADWIESVVEWGGNAPRGEDDHDG
ncbi:hypothetical protein O7626_19075 [Micromonospora sp. WMMD1102]|uniref:hypothetical protein n=1 Tax=Micromonospora sp. WMMD1102 TaxID=3016105 RepID=UPI002414EB92|nr:hypothetical protein [Micromonospora sp. WMMD1102]MDG4788016.1 hypothetical protein [Micromonospora sp. WMMD1102]